MTEATTSDSVKLSTQVTSVTRQIHFGSKTAVCFVNINNEEYIAAGFGPELWIWHRKASTLCTIYPIPLMARFGTRIHRIVQSSFLDLVNLILLINLTASEDSILVHGGKICCLIHVIVVESTQQLQLDVIRVVQLRDWILDAAIISSTFLTNYDLKWLTKASTNVLMIGTAHNVLHLFSVPERPDEHAPLLSAFNTDIIAGPTNLELIHSITGIEQTALASMEFFIPATASSLGSDIWVASGTLFNDLLLWQPFNSCRLQLRGVGHEGLICRIRWDSTGKYLCTGSDDRSLRIWIRPVDQITESASSEFKPIHTFYGHTGRVWDVSYIKSEAPNQPKDVLPIFVLGASEDATISVWNTVTGKRISTFEGHHGPIWQLAINLAGTVIASCSADSTVRCWDSAKVFIDAQQQLQGDMPTFKMNHVAQQYHPISKTVSLEKFGGLTKDSPVTHIQFISKFANSPPQLLICRQHGVYVIDPWTNSLKSEVAISTAWQCAVELEPSLRFSQLLHPTGEDTTSITVLGGRRGELALVDIRLGRVLLQWTCQAKSLIYQLWVVENKSLTNSSSEKQSESISLVVSCDGGSAEWWVLTATTATNQVTIIPTLVGLINLRSVSGRNQQDSTDESLVTTTSPTLSKVSTNQRRRVPFMATAIFTDLRSNLLFLGDSRGNLLVYRTHQFGNERELSSSVITLQPSAILSSVINDACRITHIACKSDIDEQNPTTDSILFTLQVTGHSGYVSEVACTASSKDVQLRLITSFRLNKNFVRIDDVLDVTLPTKPAPECRRLALGYYGNFPGVFDWTNDRLILTMPRLHIPPTKLDIDFAPLIVPASEMIPVWPQMSNNSYYSCLAYMLNARLELLLFPYPASLFKRSVLGAPGHVRKINCIAGGWNEATKRHWLVTAGEDERALIHIVDKLSIPGGSLRMQLSTIHRLSIEETPKGLAVLTTANAHEQASWLIAGGAKLMLKVWKSIGSPSSFEEYAALFPTLSTASSKKRRPKVKTNVVDEEDECRILTVDAIEAQDRPAVLIATGRDDCVIDIWRLDASSYHDPQASKLTKLASINDVDTPIFSIRWLRTSKQLLLLAGCSNGTLKVWTCFNLLEGESNNIPELVSSIQLHHRGINCLVTAPLKDSAVDSYIICTGGDDQSIRMVSINEKCCIEILHQQLGAHSSGVTGLDLTPDFLVSCGTDQRVILWLLEASSSPANSPSVTPVTRSLHFSKAAVTSVPDLSGVKILSTSSNEVTVVTIGVGVESICFQLPTI